MEKIIDGLLTGMIYLSFLFGAGKSFILVHNVIKKETLTQISKGLGSTENLSKTLSEE